MKRLLFILIALSFLLNLFGCQKSKQEQNPGPADNQSGKPGLTFDSFIPDTGKVYIFQPTEGDIKSNISMTWESMGKGKYRGIQSIPIGIELRETYRIQDDSVLLEDYEAVTNGSRIASESVFKGSKIICKNANPGDTWENKYSSKYIMGKTYYYNGDEKYAFTGYEKLQVMGREMEAAVLAGSDTRTREGSGSPEKINMKFWIIKDMGIVRLEVQRTAEEGNFKAAFQLVSINNKAK